MFGLDQNGILLLITTVLWLVAFYLSPAKRASKIIAYVGGACALIGIITGYLLVGFVVLIVALMAGIVVQAIASRSTGVGP
jgi:hypothetical protein